MKELKKFNVLNWDFNSDKLTHYDVMPYFRQRYEEYLEYNKDEKSDFFKVPITLDDFKHFVEKESQYQFWARCEYEMITHGWPVQKSEYKLDIHEQIMMNIDIVAEILFHELSTKKDNK